jgi:hypothetical protein
VSPNPHMGRISKSAAYYWNGSLSFDIKNILPFAVAGNCNIVDIFSKVK